MQRICFRVAAFLSAFLLFQLQPLVAKSIAPTFGGSAMVWTSCMLFFQLALLAGYCYAHGLGRLPVRSQAVIHGLVLAATLPFLTILPSFEPESVLARPLATLVGSLATSVGATFVILSATAPLLQRWYATLDERNAYHLYADSNAGSLLGLLSYPFVFEPLLDLDTQGRLWTCGAVTQLLLFGLLNALLWRANPREISAAASVLQTTPVRMADYGLWILLAAAPCAVLLAVTNKISLEVAPVPLLWVVPLALYLITFILCFGRWAPSPPFLVPLAAAVVLAGGLLRMRSPPLPSLCIALDCVLLLCCFLCHGELARRKPDPSQLTQYYLAMSLGGVLGTLFVALGAPLLFPTSLELPLVVAGSITIPLACRASLRNEMGDARRLPTATSLIGFVAIALWLSPEMTGLLQTTARCLPGRSAARIPELGTLVPVCALTAAGILILGTAIVDRNRRPGTRLTGVRATPYGLFSAIVLGGTLLAAYLLSVGIFGIQTEFRADVRSTVTSPVVLWSLGAVALRWGRTWSFRRSVPPSSETRPDNSMGRHVLMTLWQLAGPLLVSRLLIEATVCGQPGLWSCAGLLIAAIPLALPRQWLLANRLVLAILLLAAIQVPLLLSWSRIPLPYGSPGSLGLLSVISSLTVGLAFSHLPPRGAGPFDRWSVFLGGAVGVTLALLLPQSTGPSVLAGCGLLAMVQLATSELLGRVSAQRAFASALLAVVVGLSCGTLSSPEEEGETIVRLRNFYGTLRVENRSLPVPVREFIHGSVSHGRQYLDEDRRREPTMYYHRQSGIGRLLESTRRGSRNIAAVGLGVGTIAAYGQPGDRIRFFEIDPDVEAIARRNFDYLGDSEAEVDVVIADGRLALERDRQSYDVVILDAFSGDAIPTHLLTTEAVRLYLERLRPGGSIALHISNSHLDLTPIVNGHASQFGLNLVYVDYNQPGPHPRSLWAILSRDTIPVEGTANSPAVSRRTVNWTDHHHSLLGLLRVRQPR